MSTLEELQKENTDLKDSVYHLRDLVDVLLAKIRIAESGQVEQSIPQQNLNEIKAQGIEEMFYEFENEYTYHSVLPYEVLEYANKLRGDK